MACVHPVSGILIGLLALAGISTSAQEPPLSRAAGIIRGTVVDRTDGAPIAEVAVALQKSGVPAKTDGAGRVELAGVGPGRHTLYVSVVGFILVKRTVDVTAGETIEVTVALSEG